jgi:hypothetical protein
MRANSASGPTGKRIGGKCVGLGTRRKSQKAEAEEGSLAREKYGTEQQAEDHRGRAERGLEELRKGVRSPEVLSPV